VPRARLERAAGSNAKIPVPLIQVRQSAGKGPAFEFCSLLNFFQVKPNRLPPGAERARCGCRPVSGAVRIHVAQTRMWL